MNRLSRVVVLGTAALAVLTLGACRRKPAPTVEPTPTTPAVNQDSINRVRDSITAADARARAEAARRDSIARAEAAATTQRELTETLNAIIYFDYDDAELRADARAALDAKLPILLANPAVTMRVAGHTDERGSSEYNLALGQRRAASVKRYLTDRGVAEHRIETVSYGEEQPVALGADEAAWSQNRRAVFEVTSPATTLVRPRQ